MWKKAHTPAIIGQTMATVETTATLITPDDFLALPDGKDFELVDGNLQERHVGALSAWVGGTLYHFIRAFCDQNKLGLVFPSDAGYQCFPDSLNTVRKPDVSFIRTGRLPDNQIPAGWVRVVPDLVVEVVSTHDLALEVDAKVVEYQRAGVRLIWVVNPETHTVRIHRVDDSFGWLQEPETLDGEDVLPGFRCPLKNVFPPRDSGSPA